ncbi:group II intron reverse transcriptase/maturase [Flavobacterium gawalongense]|uniref:RNA-directed DNA polymerase n=2 Tax=Flavobacterium gawalongense TaxID=2594432 RepID=A0A553B808_9FLAO|nr:group II intron reverse transcriptase/maturase [Flavobacterium gawalongense]TRX00118.1 group II intron reverse transcriptase/maturase [Flavobacterium gawalongense]TRX04392.1 group II intron reverse transcriptase/maturase [Flavobacterium gawalongense]TRX05179.1 group II intron reverse transcriptase/maturase [Flavobacterium gawalongense]TRX21018.1 group II intron reverse transcriptase/maturase [Flavobacterium gawalongense]
MVKEAYRKVNSNKGSAGIDKESLEKFQENLLNNLYKIWNRMSSGSYFPQAVKEVVIPKAGGGERKLGIPTISDRIAQEVVKTYLEPRLEAVFSKNSYGYRPNKSAHNALEKVRENVRRYSWVVDMDIKAFFDEVNHELLLKAIDKHVPEKWVQMYIVRWLECPIQTSSGELVQKKGEGTPQGVVISPLLANLFLHYVLDKWLEKEYPQLTFVRYADDVIVHCYSESQSLEILNAIKNRLAECKLRLSEVKTKIVYCLDYNRMQRKDYPKKFDFLGFTFKPRSIKSKTGRGMYLGFGCEISQKSQSRITRFWKELELHRKSPLTIQDIADKVNSQIRGIIRYYGYSTIRHLQGLFRNLEFRLAKWYRNKYKERSYRVAFKRMRDIKFNYPTMFYHWQFF